MPQIGNVAVGIDETNRTIHGMSNEDKTLTERRLHMIFDFGHLYPEMRMKK